MGIKIQAGNKFYGGISISTPSPYDDILDENSGWVTVSPSSGQDGVPNVEYIQNSSWGTVSYNKPDYNGLTTIRGGIEYPYTYYEFNPTKVATKQITGLVVGQTYSIDVEGQFFQSSSEYGSIYYSNSPRRYSKIVVGVTTADTTGLFKWADISPLLEAYYIQEVPNPSGGTNPTTNPMQSTSPVEFVATSSTYTVVLSKNTDHQFPIEKMDINMVPAPAARYIIVGSERDDDKGDSSGSVYVYDATDLSAAPTKLTAFDGDRWYNFGNSIGAYNDKIVIASRHADSSTGSVYVYDANDLSATPTKLTAFDGAASDEFGIRVGVSNDKIVVGSRLDDDQGSDSGSVYVYDANDLSVTPTKLTAFDGAMGDNFGHFIAVSNDKIVVSSLYDDDKGNSSGSVYVYDANDLSATPTKLTAFDGVENDLFGFAIAVSNDKIMVSAFNDDDQGSGSGSVYVYDANDLSATPTKLTAFDGHTAAGFGFKVVAFDDKIVVGAYNDSVLNIGGGSVYVYDANDLSVAPTKLTPFDGIQYDHFGSAIGASNDKIVISSPNDDDKGNNSGSVYVYDANDLSATPTKLTAFDGAPYDDFGKTVAIL